MWLTKVRRYGGGTSVISSWDTKKEAEDHRDGLNSHLQTDAYYCEPYDPEKIEGFIAGP